MASLQDMYTLGQSPWIDYIDRELMTTDKIKQVLVDGVVGLTSNPTIWQKAFAAGAEYDSDIKAGVQAGKDTAQIYESIAISDITRAAEALRPVYDRTNGIDGFVSLEVSPDLAYDAEKTLQEARRLFKTIGVPNLMIKIPGTPQGITAYERAIGEGINVNVTLLFGIGNFYQVAEAYLRGLELRVAAKQPLDSISSVASFFVSRVDTTIDQRLLQLAETTSDEVEKQALMELRGKAGIANAKVAYEAWQSLYTSERWQALGKLGAKKQRCLWASTSTKDPSYSDVMYVEGLIGPDTVDTIPPATITAYLDHGHASVTLDKGVDEAVAQIGDIECRGISLETVAYHLQLDGVKAFSDSFESMLAAISTKAAGLQ